MDMLQEVQKQLAKYQHRWLITGAAGFIGSHLCSALLRYNQIVIGIDNLSTGSQRNILELTKHLSPTQMSHWQFINCDIRDPVTCFEVTTNIDYILHHAAVASVPQSFQDPLYSHAVNVGGFLNILTAAKSADVKRVIYASSSAVYGNALEQHKIESKTGELLSPYATDKLTNELYAKTFSRCYGLETIGLRYFNIFGPRQDLNGPYAAVIPAWINAALTKKPCIIHGDGQQTRDFCYIDNVIFANLLAALTKNTHARCEVYNVASGHSVSLTLLYQSIAKEFPYKLQIQHQNTRFGDVKHSAANIDKINGHLGFVPQISFIDGLKKTIAWYHTNHRRSVPTTNEI